MVLHIALGAIGLLETIIPRRFVDSCMRLAAKEGQDVELKPWVYTVARLEGILILLWLVTRHDKP